MPQNFRFTLLGCGSSGGVPRVGNQWGVCDPNNPRNRRRRCSLLVESRSPTAQDSNTGANAFPEGIDSTSKVPTTTILIDTGADLRDQLITAQVKHLDGVMITHSHADHIFGMDDLRQLAMYMGSSIAVHADRATSQIIMSAFDYCFQQRPGSSYPAFCTHTLIEHGVATAITGAGGTITALPLLAEHGDIHSLGFRIADLAYIPDMKSIRDEASLNALQGVRVMIVDCLRYTAHPTHMNLDESLSFIDRFKPERAILTNLSSDLDYAQLLQELPPQVVPGYDGMQLEILPPE